MKHNRLTFSLTIVISLLLILTFVGTAMGQDPGLNEPLGVQSKIKTYTTDADFDEGTLVNLNHEDVHDQLQLDSEATPFEFIWVAASGRGTIVKIDTVTGNILGEYWSAPYGRGRDPSRTTVDGNGNVWAGNRNEYWQDGRGSIVHIGLEENGQCVDRNGNGVIDTSAGLGDIRPWSNTGGADNNGGVTTADDECIIHYVRTTGTGMRTLAIDQNNDVWAGGAINTTHEKINGTNGTIIPGTQFALGCGGYGGLIDGNGILWSASYPITPLLLRYDTNTSIGACLYMGRTTYGLGIDTNGNIWLSNYDWNTVQKISPAGAIIGTFNTSGDSGDRGVAVTPADNNVWVANSFGNNISRLDNDGVFNTIITVGYAPTGIAVDAAGKVWVTNLSDDNAMRINPATNLVDLTVSLGSGAAPYNYSDMTGSTLIAPPNIGTWTVVYDSQISNAVWREISWNSSEPGDSSITVKVASSPDGVTFGPEVPVSNGGDPSEDDITGQYLKVIVSFNRGTLGASPILYDLTISTNQPPVADANGPYLVSVGEQVTFNGLGSSDPDGDPLTETWTADGGTVSGSTYTAGDTPGIYDVTLVVNDGHVDSQPDTTFAIVYDPNAGFVTGGGWIDSPDGALRLATDLPFFGGHYYQRFGESVTWTEANEAANASSLEGCASAHLATITSEEEQDAIHAAFGNYIAFAWLGGYREGGVWQWVTEEPWEYANWQPGEPSSEPVATALHVGGGGVSSPDGWIYDGKWNDTDPIWQYPYIVEYQDCGPTGKATFGFVSKYQKGASVPTGNTEFQFYAADLNFHSDSYEWLVVTSSNYARYKGVGTINGEGAYKFMLWAGDGEPDTFRIKIWEEDEFGVETVIYDNGMNQAISGGSIVVHIKK